MARSILVHLWRAGLVGALAGVAVAGVAAADAAQPTDYLSQVVSVTPATPAVQAQIVGGDAFMELTVERGHQVTVLGYQGEPYLEFAADGTVRENVRSPAHVLNRSRYGVSSLPAGVDADAEPLWEVVARSGTWAWHDHRTHWMGNTPPLGTRPGDQILDDVVPLLVDGVQVEVAVVSVWQHAPPWWPSLVAFGSGAALAVAALALARRQPVAVAVATLLVAATAALVGLWQTWSLPSETGPPLSHWVLPVAAVVAVVAGVVVSARRPAAGPFAAWAGAVAAGVALVAWSVLRRSVLDHAVLPTSAPFWLDRVVTAAAGSCAAVLVAAALGTLALRPERLRAPG